MFKLIIKLYNTKKINIQLFNRQLFPSPHAPLHFGEKCPQGRSEDAFLQCKYKTFILTNNLLFIFFSKI